MPDAFSEFQTSLTSPATSIEEVTPSDSTDLVRVTRAINVAVSGTVRMTTKDGDVADLFVAAGGVIPVRAVRIWATGTTATGIRGLS